MLFVAILGMITHEIVLITADKHHVPKKVYPNMDIVLALDNAGTTSYGPWKSWINLCNEKMVTFYIEIMKKLMRKVRKRFEKTPDKLRFAAIRFSHSGARTHEKVFGFDDTLETQQSRLYNWKCYYFGYTCFKDAMQLSYDVFQDARKDSKRIMLLITDGAPYCCLKNCEPEFKINWFGWKRYGAKSSIHIDDDEEFEQAREIMAKFYVDGITTAIVYKGEKADYHSVKEKTRRWMYTKELFKGVPGTREGMKQASEFLVKTILNTPKIDAKTQNKIIEEINRLNLTITNNHSVAKTKDRTSKDCSIDKVLISLDVSGISEVMATEERAKKIQEMVDMISAIYKGASDVIVGRHIAFGFWSYKLKATLVAKTFNEIKFKMGKKHISELITDFIKIKQNTTLTTKAQYIDALSCHDVNKATKMYEKLGSKPVEILLITGNFSCANVDEFEVLLDHIHKNTDTAKTVFIVSWGLNSNSDILKTATFFPGHSFLYPNKATLEGKSADDFKTQLCVPQTATNGEKSEQISKAERYIKSCMTTTSATPALTTTPKPTTTSNQPTKTTTTLATTAPTTSPATVMTNRPTPTTPSTTLEPAETTKTNSTQQSTSSALSKIANASSQKADHNTTRLSKSIAIFLNMSLETDLDGNATTEKYTSPHHQPGTSEHPILPAENTKTEKGATVKITTTIDTIVSGNKNSDELRTGTSSEPQPDVGHHDNAGGSNVAIIVGVTVGLILMLVGIILLVVLLRGKSRGKSETEKPAPTTPIPTPKPKVAKMNAENQNKKREKKSTAVEPEGKSVVEAVSVKDRTEAVSVRKLQMDTKLVKSNNEPMKPLEVKAKSEKEPKLPKDDKQTLPAETEINRVKIHSMTGLMGSNPPKDKKKQQAFFRTKQ